ncbi:MAG: SMR family transporter, partial [Brevundimonas sp.]|uniref:DMT family transporter n=1 Tax=Brevundimonas sp. TaxID=1871086 RepID=UPI002735A3F2
MLDSFGFLWLATQKLPIGTAYGVWTGIGAVGAATVGILAYGEPATALRLVCIVLIVSGIVGLKVFSGATV